MEKKWKKMEKNGRQKSYIPAHKLDAVFMQLVGEINGEVSFESETESEGRFYQYLYYL